ncbi:MAG: hypothetical protein ACRDGN_02880 [bacterium]
MMGRASNLLAYPRTLKNLAHLVGQPITLEESKATIRRRLGEREERFLDYVNRYIYRHPRSPYLSLLRHAGCEFSDLTTMVRTHGLEPTLETLRDEGVYLSFEEFKGRMEIKRGGRTFRFAEGDFDNPFQGHGMEIRTGATRSAGTRVNLALDFVEAQRATSYHVMLDAIGAATVPLFIWFSGYPSGAGISAWLSLAHMSRPSLRWFSMADPVGPSVARRHRLLLQIARLLARRRGLDLPMPEFAPVFATAVVLDAMLSARRQDGGCALITSPSAAVRIAALARKWGETLEDVRFLVGSEPLTAGKAQEIRGMGAVVGTMYVFSEGGAVGVACGDPREADDMHFMADCYAMILNRRPVVGVGELDAYMFTSLLPSAPKVMLNVESDDFGEFAVRRCGCVFDQLGFHHHFSGVRSFTKLTGEGATVLGTDCIRILEEVLPAEFGGRSIDYQLLEAEDEDHLTRLFLVVHPDVGSVNERDILNRFAQELRRTEPRNVLSALWTQADTIRVVRREPVQTARGKLLPFHTQGITALSERAPAR